MSQVAVNTRIREGKEEDVRIRAFTKSWALLCARGKTQVARVHAGSELLLLWSDADPCDCFRQMLEKISSRFQIGKVIIVGNTGFGSFCKKRPVPGS